VLLPQTVFSDGDTKQGEHLYKTFCSSCHGLSGGMDMRQRVAPPIAAVRFHYIGTYPDKTSFVTAITNWVEKQDENKSLMRGAIRRFNIMPPISISREDTQKIASYIYTGNIEKPPGFDKHVEEMHGNH
jgi:cytochrome c